MGSANTKSPTGVDREIGERIRARRVQLGLSQGYLGGAVGITFQQVQKYEKGSNRVSVSRLQAIAHALGASLAELTGDEPVPAEIETEPHGSPMPADGLQLLRDFGRIESRKVRRQVIRLVSAIAGGAEDR